MSNENNMDRISYLEKRVAELQEELARAKSPGIFCKVLITLLLAGSCFLIWKCRIFFKWAILALLAYWIFGGFVINAFKSTGEFFSDTWAEWKQNSKIKDEHERNMERIRTESEAVNSKLKIESDARVSETRATAEAKTSEIKAGVDAQVKVMQTEESIEKAKWERGQAERRNDAVNDAIRNGTWNSSNKSAPIETASPTPVSDPPAKNDVEISTSSKRQPTIIRRQDGNVTRVTVKF